jgi:hypothetical protein
MGCCVINYASLTRSISILITYPQTQGAYYLCRTSQLLQEERLHIGYLAMFLQKAFQVNACQILPFHIFLQLVFPV